MSKRTGRKAKNTKSKDNPTATSVAESEDNVTLPDAGEMQGMKRAQLQKLCKQFGLKATGKVRKWLFVSVTKIVVALWVEKQQKSKSFSVKYNKETVM